MIPRLLVSLLIASSLVSSSPAQTLFPTGFQTKEPAPPGPPLLPGPCPQGATSLLIPLDNTFQVVTFDGLGGNGPANPGDPCQRNDDDVTLSRPLQFTFDLFGQTFNTVFINNNGNVSFGASFSQFTSTGFPVTGFPMVAPFWADVDTRALTSGVVYFKSEPTRFTVIWDHVGYYNIHADKLCTFELVISNGNDPVTGLGNNVCFSYDDMQWTTGDASGGVGGFGGTPATVGCNRGDGTNFFQIGRFGVPGGAYDGPGGATDGVDFLDNTEFCFNVGQTISNVPPIFLNPPSSCITAHVGVPLSFQIQAIGPENNQTVTLSVAGSPTGFSSNLTAGNPATANNTWRPSASQVGQHLITFTATDNFSPPASAMISVCIDVLPSVTSFCPGDGAANGGPDCPCLNSTPVNPNGCLNSLGVGGALNTTGSPSLSGDTLQLVATNLPTGVPGLFLSGTQQQPAVPNGFGVALGDGLRCIAGTIVRLDKFEPFPAGGSVVFPGTGDPPLSTQYPVSIGEARYYQVWYRNSLGPCGFGTNTTNAVSVYWAQ